MQISEYFGDWWKCIDPGSLKVLLNTLPDLYKNHKVYPEFKNIFKAFELCPYNKLKVVIIGQDPYPDGNATGIAFANNINTNELSPSLVVIKTLVEDLYMQDRIINFNPDLTNWARQGVLLLNSSLTVEAHNPNSHTMIWRPFISSFIKRLSEWNTGLIYVLMGTQAQTFKPYIGKFNDIIEVKHPAFYARTNTNMPDIFTKIDKLTLSKNNLKINWL